MAKLENYKGSLQVSAGLKPMGDFPVAEAHDILVDENGTRLDEKLNSISVVDDAAKEDIINRIETLEGFKRGVTEGNEYVKKAESADVAYKAIQDFNGNPIVDYYATKYELSDIEAGLTKIDEPIYKPVTIEGYNSLHIKGYWYFEIVFSDGVHYHLGMIYWDGKSRTRTWLMQPDLWEYYLNISEYGKVTLRNSDDEIQDDLSKLIRVGRIYIPN